MTDSQTAMGSTRFAEGRTKTGGRQKGSLNKTTAAVKEAILRAFDKVGGEDYLVTVAENDPKTFCALLGKVLPAEIKGSASDGVLELRIVQ